MLAQILNRHFQQPADGWYMIEPKGEHPHAATGLTLVIDQPALSSIAQRFNGEAAAQGDSFPGLLVDHEHFSHSADKETRAFGWLTALQARPDGLYGQVRWTGTGRAAVDGGDYRFFSSEYLRADCQDAGGGKLRPTRLAGLTLTNRPNNKGGKPITNSEDRGPKLDVGIVSSVIHPPSAEAPTFPAERHLTVNDALALVVERERRSSGLTFQRSWDLARERHPALFRAAAASHRPTRVFNRAPTAAPRLIPESVRIVMANCPALAGLDPQALWDAARSNSQAVFESLERKLAYRSAADGGKALFHSVDDLQQAFEAQVHERMARGLAADEAWDLTRVGQPVLWVRYILTLL